MRILIDISHPAHVHFFKNAVAELARRHQRFSPSGIELFLTCPFRFFVERTLRLVEPPPEAADRLDALTGELLIHTEPGNGTTLTGTIPVPVEVPA